MCLFMLLLDHCMLLGIRSIGKACCTNQLALSAMMHMHLHRVRWHYLTADDARAVSLPSSSAQPTTDSRTAFVAYYGQNMASLSRSLPWPDMDCCSDGLVEGVRALTQRPALACLAVPFLILPLSESQCSQPKRFLGTSRSISETEGGRPVSSPTAEASAALRRKVEPCGQ